MKILAIDTTGLVASVAVVTEEKVVAEFTINYKKTHSQTLMPMIEQVAREIELDLKTIDYIACASGPGSFTGLRIGAATAKGLACGLGIGIIPIPTLDGLAYNLPYSNRIVVPIMDARRNQVYTGFFRCDNGNFSQISDYMADDIMLVLEKLKQLGENAVFLGDGVPVFKDKILEFDSSYTFAPINCNLQRAASIGALALQRVDFAVDSADFEIIYLRKSQAEREMGL